MLIKSESRYIEGLKEIWQRAFGDSDEYISLFFTYAYDNAETFAEFDGEKIVSVLYLLSCEIRVGDKLYKGRYLYAAATMPEYRSRGIMSRLIREAQSHAEKQALDFIALVPGQESLYDYYRRFSFESTMFKSKGVLEGTAQGDCPSDELTFDEVYNRRKNIPGDLLMPCYSFFSYALHCLSFYGYGLYPVGKEGYIIYSSRDGLAEELIAENDNDLKSVEACLKGKTDYFSPTAENKIPFGMLYPINKELSQAQIYMNIALD